MTSVALRIAWVFLLIGCSRPDHVDAAGPGEADKPWTIELTGQAGVVIRYDGTRAAALDYVAWGPSFKAAGFKTTIGPNQNNTWTVTGAAPLLNMKFTGLIRWNESTATLTYEYTTDFSAASDNNIGGGVEFALRRDRQVFGDVIPEPVLSDTGFTWHPRANSGISVTFDALRSKPFLEKNKPDKVRAFFISQSIPLGVSTRTMTIQLPPGTKRLDGPGKRYGRVDASWQADTINWKTSPIDLSYLNHKPAGIKGFVRADGDKLVYGDGSEAKFWGTNVVAYALFNATDAAIEQQAKRIAALGFNLVRIHHHDSANWSPSVFIKDAGNTIDLDDKQLARIDYWIKCLKDNGVYVWLDLHVGRPFAPGDGITAYDELTYGKAGRQAKGLSYVNESVTKRMKEFADLYLKRKNIYTGIAYVDEPAIMGILITNENDITHHFGNLFLPEKKLPAHEAMYKAIRDPIVKEKALDWNTVWKTWEPGDSKIVLNEIEYRWNIDFIAHLKSIGVKAPIATTSTWGNNPLFSLPSLTVGDVIDVHAYGDSESLSSNPKYDDMSTHWIAAAQVQDRPLVITEWNTPATQRDRFTQPLVMASQAAFQGWDAPMIYAYQQSPLEWRKGKIDEFGISNDPAQLAMMPAAALAYRAGHVAPAKQTVVFAPTANQFFNTAISPLTSPALRTISERHRLVIALPTTPKLPWLKGSDNNKPLDIDTVADGTTDESITSDTGELTRNWQKGTYTVNTPLTQAAMGWIGAHAIVLNDITIETSTPKAAIAVTSLDGLPIASSKRLLVSYGAQAQIAGKPGEIVAEPVKGTVLFKNGIKQANVLNPDGAISSEVPVEGNRVELTGIARTHWMIVPR